MTEQQFPESFYEVQNETHRHSERKIFEGLLSDEIRALKALPKNQEVLDFNSLNPNMIDAELLENCQKAVDTMGLKIDCGLLWKKAREQANKLIAKHQKQKEKDRIATLKLRATENNQEPIKPEIVLPKEGKLISEFIYEIAPLIAEKKELFYRPQDKSIVCLDTIPSNKDNNKKLLGFKVVSPQSFVTSIEKIITPVISSYNPKLNETIIKPKSLTTETSKIVLGSSQLQERLPIIQTIYSIPLPILIDNKIRFPKEGYDEFFQSYMPEDCPKIIEMPLQEAKDTLNFIFKEFCFKNKQDETNATALLLTPMLRGLYSRNTARTPIGFYKGNRERVGKDFLGGVTGIVYYGTSIDETPISDEKGCHDEELRKKVLSTFKQGNKRFHSSNNKGYINSAELEAIATNENFSDRLLGQNTMATFPNDLEISLSANVGITYTPDLGNRSIFVNLFLDIENPNERKFENPNLHDWVRLNRSKIISALYSLILNWFNKGMPKGSVPFASFPEWASVCGGIMEAAELGNPCIPNDDLINIGGDTETRDMKRLFELCFQHFPQEWILKKVIMEKLETDEDFAEIFTWIDWNKKGSKNKFGVLFEKFVGRVFSDIKLIRLDNSKNERRKYQFVKNNNGVDGGRWGSLTSRDILPENINNNIKGIEVPQVPPSTPLNFIDILKQSDTGLTTQALSELIGQDVGTLYPELLKLKEQGLVFEPKPDCWKVV